MIRFLLKGLLRDHSRSLFPVIIVAIGVALTVFLHAWLNGVIAGMIQSTANFRTGHVSVMTRAFAEKIDQSPNDLALLGVDTILVKLKKDFPSLAWTPRISFGGLLDIPDENGETKEQAPVAGIAVDLFSPESPEWKILNLRSAIVRGNLPVKKNEILISEELAQQIRIQPGQNATLISSSMYGSMTLTNFVIAGTIRFGVGAMDRGAIIADVYDIQQALDMNNGASSILGFFNDEFFHEEKANKIALQYNYNFSSAKGKFVPIMETLRTASGLSDYLDIIGSVSGIIIGIFVSVMSIVLWNAGLVGSLRRFGEFGLRLAVGENKSHVYFTLLIESLAVGVIGSIIGTAVGLLFAFYLQMYGLNVGDIMKSSSLLIGDVLRARIVPFTYIIGFFPGIFATLLGAAISGIGIYKRQTSQLFKELEA